MKYGILKTITTRLLATVFAVSFAIFALGCEDLTNPLNSSTGNEEAARVAKPTASPGAGAVALNTAVTLATATDGAVIYYTTDESDPATSDSRTEYTSAIIITGPVTIKAIAVKTDLADSDLLTAAYTIDDTLVAVPTASPAEGTYHEVQTVTLTSGTEGAAIHYTLDGTPPTAESETYTDAVTINGTKTLKAIAVKADKTDSDVLTAEYILTPETPTAAPEAGNATVETSVTLTSGTTDAVIYYTTDGSDPGATKTPYESPITLNAGTTTIKAVATKAGWDNSAVFEAAYTVPADGNTDSPDQPGNESPPEPPAPPLTDEVVFANTDTDTSGTNISEGITGSGADQTGKLSVVEEPLAYFAVIKSATQTITVGGADEAKVTQITANSAAAALDGSTATDTVDLFSVNMEDLLFDGAFGGSIDGAIIPTGKETRTFTLTVSESNCTSRVITVALDITLDQDTETTIYHREGEPGNYYYVKVRDAELTDDDKNVWSSANTSGYKFTAFDKGKPKDLQNAFVWVDHHGTEGDSTVGAVSFANETPSTDGYSEYRLFLKKNQQIGRINFIMLNGFIGGTRFGTDKFYDTDTREYISIELWGAGAPGRREQRITRSEVFSGIEQYDQTLNYSDSGTGFISLIKHPAANSSTKTIYRPKALVLGKNITLAGDGESVPVLGQGWNAWRYLMVENLIAIDQNSMVIIDDYSKITNYSGIFAPIAVQAGGKVYLKGGAITGNTLMSTGVRCLVSRSDSRVESVIGSGTDTTNNMGMDVLTNN